MRFQVLSHAGLLVEHNGKSLICDPWVLGSCYWRSWWNYPPVSEELLESLNPDYIYLTHVHWDHFQGPSLRLFGKKIPILIPYEPCGRMKRDLFQMGFKNVTEIKHGGSFNLDQDFKLTSYHFGVFLDSCVIVEAGGSTLFNANDAKVMGNPLNQILKNHPSIDFVFRSHSSANSRLCFEIIDDNTAVIDDIEKYVSDFAAFVSGVNATYAIPFASNQCYLHAETFHFNNSSVTPAMVEQYFKANDIKTPILKVMVSGDSWSQESGFNIAPNTFFSKREEHLEQYRLENIEKLENADKKELRTQLSSETVATYFSGVFKAMPTFIRRTFKGHPITYILSLGNKKIIYSVDFFNKSVTEKESYSDQADPIQIHTSAALMKHCMRMHLFSHLAISKRVKYRVTSQKKKYLEKLNLFNNFYEYDYLPVSRILNYRFISSWSRRWREPLLYIIIILGMIRGRGFEFTKQLPAPNP